MVRGDREVAPEALELRLCYLEALGNGPDN
jgi:hypothetical protein